MLPQGGSETATGGGRWPIAKGDGHRLLLLDTKCLPRLEKVIESRQGNQEAIYLPRNCHPLWIT